MRDAYPTRKVPSCNITNAMYFAMSPITTKIESRISGLKTILNASESSTCNSLVFKTKFDLPPKKGALSKRISTLYNESLVNITAQSPSQKILAWR